MLAHPIVLISVYVMVFSVILKVRVASSLPTGSTNYTLYLLAGLVPWLVSSEAINKACMLMVQQVNLVKQVIFPLNILPIKNGIASTVLLCIYLSLLLIYVAVDQRGFPIMVLLLPILIALQMAFLVGCSYILATIGVFFRDIRELLVVFTFVAPYMSPIFFLPEQALKLFRPLFYINPFSYIVWCYQDIFYFQHFAHPWAWFVVVGMTLIALSIGYRAFNFLRPHFSDVL